MLMCRRLTTGGLEAHNVSRYTSHCKVCVPYSSYLKVLFICTYSHSSTAWRSRTPIVRYYFTGTSTSTAGFLAAHTVAERRHSHSKTPPILSTLYSLSTELSSCNRTIQMSFLDDVCSFCDSNNLARWRRLRYMVRSSYLSYALPMQGRAKIDVGEPQIMEILTYFRAGAMTRSVYAQCRTHKTQRKHIYYF